MSSSSQGTENLQPSSFPQVNPTGDLSGHRQTLGFALGELTANIINLKEYVTRHVDDQNSFKTSINNDIKDLKSSLKTIEDKVLVANTQVSATFYTGKYFLAGVLAVAGWAAGHWGWIDKLIGK